MKSEYCRCGMRSIARAETPVLTAQSLRPRARSAPMQSCGATVPPSCHPARRTARIGRCWETTEAARNGTDAGQTVWDMAHHGSGGYLAYLVTGDYYYLETMQHQAALCYLCNHSNLGAGTARRLLGQSRAMGWSLRTVGQLAAIGPSGGQRDERLCRAARQQHDKLEIAAPRRGPHSEPLGILYSFRAGAACLRRRLHRRVQQNFITQSVGHLSDIEALADLTALNLVRDYYYRWPVGLLGPDGSTNYCYTRRASTPSRSPAE